MKETQTNIAMLVVLTILCIVEAIILLPYSLLGTIGFIIIATVLIILTKLEHNKLSKENQ